MTQDQQKIVDTWVKAGLMQPSKYWPFTQQSPSQLAKERKQKLIAQINAAETALL